MYRFERLKLKLPRELDRRVKLTDEQRLEIEKLGATVSRRGLARMFGVSRRLIQFILDPESLAEAKRNQKERKPWLTRYNKQRNTEIMREHRAYKKAALREAGLL